MTSFRDYERAYNEIDIDAKRGTGLLSSNVIPLLTSLVMHHPSYYLEEQIKETSN